MKRLVAWAIALVLAVTPVTVASSAPSSPASQGSVRQLPVGDWGMIQYASHISTPDSQRFNRIVQALYAWYGDSLREELPDFPYELGPPNTVFHIIRYQDFLEVLRPFKRDEAWKAIMSGEGDRRSLTIGFYTRRPDSLEAHIYWYGPPNDEDLVHEMLHAIRDQLGLGGKVHTWVTKFMTSRYYKDVIEEHY